MAKIAQAFDNTNNAILRSLPRETEQSGSSDLPWATLADGAMPPMMFELRLQDGSVTSFAYSDIRQIRCPDAGRVELSLLSMCKLVITIEGRHLRDLASYFGCALIRWVKEADPRDREKPDEAAEIVKITVEEIED